MKETSKPLIDLKSAGIPLLPDRLCPLVEDVFSFSGINRVHAEISRRMSQPDFEKNFFETALDVLDANIELEAGDLDKIPTEGPVIAVANHPLGGLDGVVLGAVLARARPDIRLIVNYLLGGAEVLRPWIFQVDPFERPQAARTNLAGLKQSMGWLRHGRMLGTFPAGMVSRANLRERSITDRPWNPSVARLVRRGQASVLPIYFEGRNSLFFQAAGLCHPLLRTVLLPREMIKRKDRTIRLKIGDPLPYRMLREFASDEEMTACLRLNVYMLKNRLQTSPTNTEKSFFIAKNSRNFPQTVISEVPKDKIFQQIENLPQEQMLLRQGRFKVFYAKSAQIPDALREIGRLREITFRHAGEGTGRSCALEPCDSYYEHIFLWNLEKKEIVGGYRLGKVDEILPLHGIKGLYTSKLFSYKADLFSKMNPAIELGRSFIRPEYQKKHGALALIWKGIGRYLALHPRYVMLFGAVSTSQEYLVISKDIIREFLKNTVFDSSLASFVKAKNPPPRSPFHPAEKESIRKGLRRIDDVSTLISGLERDGKGVPVLLRQYLKLNAAILSFNIDKDFCNVMDSLVVVDVRRADKRILRKFMGQEGADRYFTFHESKAETSPVNSA